MPEEGKKRWCGACGKAKGAISLTTKQMCESCGNKRAHFGTPEEGKRRWCGACGKAKGAISLTTQQMCEGCGNKQPAPSPAAAKETWKEKLPEIRSNCGNSPVLVVGALARPISRDPRYSTPIASSGALSPGHQTS